MATRSNQTSKQELADIRALAAYKRRADAIELLMNGRFDEFMDWAVGPGHEAAGGAKHKPPNLYERYDTLTNPLALDEALIYERLGDDSPYFGKAYEDVPMLSASPLEMVVRYGSDEAFDAMLSYFGSPKVRFELEGRFHGVCSGVWWSGPRRLFNSSDRKCKTISNLLRSHVMIMPICVMVGRKDRADALLRGGWLDDDGWAKAKADVEKLQELPLEWQLRLTDGKVPDYAAARAWIDDKCALSSRLEKATALLLNSGTREAARLEIRAIAEAGVGIGASTLEMASLIGDAELLTHLFRHGANPNGRNDSGDPAMASLARDTLDSEILQAWLDAGANTSVAADPDIVFDGSLLAGLACSGQLDRLKQACEGGVKPIDLRPCIAGEFNAPLLAWALRYKIGEVALWLVEEKGCRLTDIEPESGSPCVDFGAGELLAKVQVAIDAIEAGKSARVPNKPKSTLKDRSDII